MLKHGDADIKTSRHKEMLCHDVNKRKCLNEEIEAQKKTFKIGAPLWFLITNRRTDICDCRVAFATEKFHIIFSSSIDYNQYPNYNIIPTQDIIVPTIYENPDYMFVMSKKLNMMPKRRHVPNRASSPDMLM